MPARGTIEETYLTPRELCKRLHGVTVRMLRNWPNIKAGGPPNIKAGGKVLYPLSHLLKWEAANTDQSEQHEPPVAE